MQPLLILNGDYVIFDPYTYSEGIGIYVNESGIIEDIDENRKVASNYDGEVIDCSGQIVMPGLINSHTHLTESLCKGLGKEYSLHDWLYKVIYPAGEAMLENKDLQMAYYSSLLSCIELIRSGTTRVVEQSCNFAKFFVDEIAEAILTSGLEGMVARGAEDISGYPSLDLDVAQEVKDSERFIKRWRAKQKADEKIVPAFGPSTILGCSKELLQELKLRSRQLNVPYMIHLAETSAERDFCIKNFDTYGSVYYANELGLLDSKTIADHLVWIDENEISILEQKNVKAVHNPTSNQILCNGIAPVAEMQDRICVGLGTDGAASNDLLSMFQEMKNYVLLQRVKYGNPQVATPSKALQLATLNGQNIIYGVAKACKIAKGFQADIITLEARRSPQFHPNYDPLALIVLCGLGAQVKHSIVHGRVIMENEVIKTINDVDVFEKIGECSQTIKYAVESSKQQIAN